nr:FUSC family protein [Pedobacter sp. ASV19]
MSYLTGENFGAMAKTFYQQKDFIYILQCIIGLCICYALYYYFPGQQFFWSMVSVVLVIAPNNKDSNQLAFDRMKANILGSSVGLLLFLIHRPNLFMICIGIALTLLIGIGLKLNSALRSSLSALVIVMIHEEDKNSTWHIAFERMGCVMLGCVVGLLVTIVFNAFGKWLSKLRPLFIR